jgi:CheY-like chemotaxis protein
MMGEPRRILLVEDNSNDVELTLAALAEHNMAGVTVVVRDGGEALDYLHRRGRHAERPVSIPAVVLLDLKMPKLSGLDVLRELKSDPLLNAIPVIMLTSSREEDDLEACYRLGANAYVVKPVDFNEFSTAVRLLAGFWLSVNELPPAVTRAT